MSAETTSNDHSHQTNGGGGDVCVHQKYEGGPITGNSSRNDNGVDNGGQPQQYYTKEVPHQHPYHYHHVDPRRYQDDGYRNHNDSGVLEDNLITDRSQRYHDDHDGHRHHNNTRHHHYEDPQHHNQHHHLYHHQQDLHHQQPSFFNHKYTQHHGYNTGDDNDEHYHHFYPPPPPSNLMVTTDTSTATKPDMTEQQSNDGNGDDDITTLSFSTGEDGGGGVAGRATTMTQEEQEDVQFVIKLAEVTHQEVVESGSEDGIHHGDADMTTGHDKSMSADGHHPQHAMVLDNAAVQDAREQGNALVIETQTTTLAAAQIHKDSAQSSNTQSIDHTTIPLSSSTSASSRHCPELQQHAVSVASSSNNDQASSTTISISPTADMAGAETAITAEAMENGPDLPSTLHRKSMYENSQLADESSGSQPATQIPAATRRESIGFEFVDADGSHQQALIPGKSQDENGAKHSDINVPLATATERESLLPVSGKMPQPPPHDESQRNTSTGDVAVGITGAQNTSTGDVNKVGIELVQTSDETSGNDVKCMETQTADTLSGMDTDTPSRGLAPTTAPTLTPILPGPQVSGPIVAGTASTKTVPQPKRRPTYKTGRWLIGEKMIFLHIYRRFGKGKWKNYAPFLPYRSLTQIKSHAQKVMKRENAGDDIFRELDESGLSVEELMARVSVGMSNGPYEDELLFVSTHKQWKRKYQKTKPTVPCTSVLNPSLLQQQMLLSEAQKYVVQSHSQYYAANLDPSRHLHPNSGQLAPPDGRMVNTNQPPRPSAADANIQPAGESQHSLTGTQNAVPLQQEHRGYWKHYEGFDASEDRQYPHLRQDDANARYNDGHVQPHGFQVYSPSASAVASPPNQFSGPYHQQLPPQEEDHMNQHVLEL